MLPWYEKHKDWTPLASWIHDNLPYASQSWFPKLTAFNLRWSANPSALRCISTYVVNPHTADLMVRISDQAIRFIPKPQPAVAQLRCEILLLKLIEKTSHFTRCWNPAKEDQATDRAYRIGQKKDVYVYYPTVRDTEMPTFEATLDELLSRRRMLARDMLTGAAELKASDFDSLLGAH